MAGEIACGALTSTASNDSARDVFFAQQIAAGAYFPLSGPAINSMLHLGPLWFYVLAPILWLIPNAAAVTAVMALIGAAQFPLAYQLGRQVGSPRAGILFVLGLALPGYLASSLGLMTHVIAVIPSVLFAALATLNYRSAPCTSRAVVLGLALACAINSHPTAWLLAAILGMWSMCIASAWRERAAHAAIVAGLLALSLAPMLYEQFREGFPDGTATAAQARNEWSFPSLVAGLRLIYATVFNGPRYVLRFWMEWPASTVRVAFAIYAAVVVAGIGGVLLRFVREPKKRRLITVLAIMLLLQSMFVSAVRAVMPPWMVLAHLPLVAALLALGWETCCATGRHVAALIGSGLTVTTVVTLLIWIGFMPGPLDHAEISPSAGMRGSYDVRDYEETAYTYRLPRIPFRQLFALGEPLCQPVTLYGHYAYLVDLSFAVSAMQRCGQAKSVQFGGDGTPAASYVGLHESAWARLGSMPATRIGVIGITRPTAVWHSPVPTQPRFPRLLNTPPPRHVDTRQFSISGTTTADQAVLVSHRAHRSTPFRVIGATLNGKPVESAYRDEISVIFRAPAEYPNGAQARWEVQIEATAEYVDVLTFATER